jgi:predicted enzyme related to lactoylglutathione lyase
VAARLAALCVDAHDPSALARFWGELLGWSSSGAVLLPPDDTGFALRFEPAGAPKTVPNQMHFDLTSRSLDDQQRTVERALGLGAGPIDVGQRPDEGHVVLADPEGNEFCVVEPGNAFLADCGFLGAIACDGSHATGLFWSRALGWPLVWDQDEETAIRAPHGGPKISWGGPPLRPRTGRYRLRFELSPTDRDPASEVERLVALGATSIGVDGGRPVLIDPDGHEFCVAGAPPRG